MDEHKLKDKKKAFIVKDGTTLQSVKDLYGHLAIISDEHFKHHVNEKKNDFAVWIEDVHGDKFIAAAVRRARSKEEVRKAVFIALFN